MKIGFASTDWSFSTKPRQPGGAGWYRCALPARMLASQGHTTVHGMLAGKRQQRRNGFEFVVETEDGTLHDGCNIIVMQRYMNRELADDMRLAQASGQIIINDVDDWYFGLDTTNQAWLRSHPKTAPDVNVNHYQRILGTSDALTVSTPYLARRLEQLMPGQHITVIRNAIDLDRWTRQPIRDTDELRVGWIGATPWRSGDLETLKGILGPWMRQHRARFYHGGHMDSAAKAGVQLGLDGDYDVRGLHPISQYPDLFEGFDIGLVPLRDTPFNYAKSAIKGMEYAAAGIPYIAALTPEYAWLGAGRLAKRPRDWKRHLDSLLDPAERKRIADEAYERVQQQTLTQRAPEWDAALRSVTRRKRGIPQAV